MARYNERGNVSVTINDTSIPFGIYAADGSLRLTLVSGSTLTGLYASDGSYNAVIVEADDVPVSIYHPCGALRCVYASSETGVSAPNGAVYIDTGYLSLFTVTPEVGGETALISINLNASVTTGVVYFIVALASAAVPAGPQIVAGTDGSDAAAVWLGNASAASVNTYNGPITGTTAEIAYKSYAVWTNGVDYSPVMSASFTSLEAPTWPEVGEYDRILVGGEPRVLEGGEQRSLFLTLSDILSAFNMTPLASETEATATVTVRPDIEDGTLTIVIYPDDVTDPDEEDIVNHVDGDGNSVSAFLDIPIVTIDAIYPPFGDLLPGTPYKARAVWLGTIANYSNIVSDTFTTDGVAPSSIAASLLADNATALGGYAFSGIDGSVKIIDQVTPANDYEDDLAQAITDSKITVAGTLTPSSVGVTITGSNYTSVPHTVWPYAAAQTCGAVFLDMTPTIPEPDSNTDYEYTFLNVYIGTTTYFRVYCSTTSSRLGQANVALRGAAAGNKSRAGGSNDLYIAGGRKRIKLAITWDSSGLSFCVNGGTVYSSTGAAYAAALNLASTWRIGHGGSSGTNGASPINGELVSAIFMPLATRKTDAELIAWGD